jgi:hypothetical protein
MQNNFFSKSHTDLWGFGAALTCAVHCGMLPMILTFSSLSGLKWLGNPWIELSFILLSFCIAAFAITRNFRRHKHIMLAVKVVALGFALIIVAHMVGGIAEYFIAAAGGVTIAFAHILNWRLARKSECCEHH